MVFSEGDLLSGLVVNRFAEYLVVQVTALAMAVRLETILSQLMNCCGPPASCSGPSVTWSRPRGSTKRCQGPFPRPTFG